MNKKEVIKKRRKKISKKTNIIIASSILGVATISTSIIVPIVIISKDDKKPDVSINTYSVTNNILNLTLKINRSNLDSTNQIRDKIIKLDTLSVITEIRLEINNKLQIITISNLDPASHNLKEFIDNNKTKWFDAILTNRPIPKLNAGPASPVDNDLTKQRGD